jgi:hypothetical protein
MKFFMSAFLAGTLGAIVGRTQPRRTNASLLRHGAHATTTC